MKARLVLNLSEEIYAYVGELPQGAWSTDAETVEYGAPDELAFSAAYVYFGNVNDTLVEDEMEMLACEVGNGTYNEPHDEFYFSVLHSLNASVATIRQHGLVHLTDAEFAFPSLVLELSTEMDMSKYHAKAEPPES